VHVADIDDPRDLNRDGVVNIEEAIYAYVHHPWTRGRLDEGPIKTVDQFPAHNTFVRFNSWLGLKITLMVGTMICAYLFAVLALVSLPASLETGNPMIIVAWVAQTFLQLILLPIIIVGQNIQATTADRRAQQTFDDVKATLHEIEQMQQHLSAQDAIIQQIYAAHGGNGEA
jgi:hypothetical protein